MFRIRIISNPEGIERLRTRGPEVIAGLIDKMNLLMLMLQSKIVGEEIPAMFPNGAPNISASVRSNPAVLDGSVIRGSVESGGPRTTKTTLKSGALVDYAAVQHEGVSHSYQILPFSKKALAFLLDGKQIIVQSVTHPGLKARPFMRQGLQDMQDEIIAGLQDEFNRQVAG